MPTIGVLFLANVAAATAIGITLLLPIERLGGRWGGVAVVLVGRGRDRLGRRSLAMLIVAESSSSASSPPRWRCAR